MPSSFQFGDDWHIACMVFLSETVKLEPTIPPATASPDICSPWKLETEPGGLWNHFLYCVPEPYQEPTAIDQASEYGP